VPEPFFPEVFPSQDSLWTWPCNPGLAIALAFVVVPVALAILCLVLQFACDLLRGGGASPLRRNPGTASLPPGQREPRTAAAGVGRCRCTTPAGSATAASPFRPRRRSAVRRTAERRSRRRWRTALT
jgi:hypothetical protein